MKKNDVFMEILEIVDDLYAKIELERKSLIGEISGDCEEHTKIMVEKIRKERSETKNKILELFFDMWDEIK